jgi:hypothetical protein
VTGRLGSGGGGSIAGVPLRVTQNFVMVAVLAGFFAGRNVATTAAARRVGLDVRAVELHAAGGFVELGDDDRLTAGRLAAVAGAGPVVTGALALVAAPLLSALGWPLTGGSRASGADVAAGRVLSAVFTINLVGLVVNLLPFRPLDGGHLLTAARLWRGRS